MKTFVKKICSLNPTKYKFVAIDTAISQYNTYIVDCIESIFDIKLKENYPKTFKVWLRSEI